MKEKSRTRTFNPEAIRELRRREGVTQRYLAGELDVSLRSIKNYETGVSTPAGRVVDAIWRKYIFPKYTDLDLYKKDERTN